MQIDFHYYATYVLARAAGLAVPHASGIARAAQFVDDAVGEVPIHHPDGSRFTPEVTAHRTAQLLENMDADDQLRVWVPFHFLPGGKGDSLSARLVCRKNSPIVQDLVKWVLASAHEAFAVDLLGVVAHVYADTFAHAGFSGVSSRRNRVRAKDISINEQTPAAGEVAIREKLQRFFDKYAAQALVDNFRSVVTGLANRGALGHAAVGTCPDQPYLFWSFDYEFPHLAGSGADRANPLEFLEASGALYAMFSDFADARPDLAGEPRIPFEEVEQEILSILRTVGSKAARVAAWQDSVEAGRIALNERQIPPYSEARMRAAWDALRLVEDQAEAVRNPAYRFAQAASAHRWFVLRELLPRHGIALV